MSLGSSFCEAAGARQLADSSQAQTFLTVESFQGETFTEKLENAIASAPDIGTTILIPSGNNIVDREIVVSKNSVTLSGANHTSCRLIRGHNAGAIVRFQGTAEDPILNCGLKNIFSYGRGEASIDKSPFDFVFDHCINPRVLHLTVVADCGALSLQGVYGSYMEDLNFFGKSADPSGVALMAVSTSNVRPDFLSGDNRLTGFNIQCGSGVAEHTSCDVGILILSGDGFEAVNGHIVNSRVADLEVRSKSGNTIYNTRFADVMLDHCSGCGIILAGDGRVEDFAYVGTIGGLHKAMGSGMLVATECKSVVIDALISGFQHAGVEIDNVKAEVLIRSRGISNNGSDTEKTPSYEVECKAAKRLIITGGYIGESANATDSAGVLIGADCQFASISGVTMQGNNNSVIIAPPNGVDNRVIAVSGNVIGGAIVDHSKTSKKVIDNYLIPDTGASRRPRPLQ